MNSSENASSKNLISNLAINESLLSMSIIVNIFMIFTIYLSKQRLIRTEFIILIALNIQSIVLKILLAVSYLFDSFLLNYIIGPCSYLIIFLAIPMSCFVGFTSQFYYSLYQVSTVSRNKIFKAIFTQVHNVQKFLRFELAMIAISMLVVIPFAVGSFLKDRTCLNFNIFIVYNFIFLCILPSFLPMGSILHCNRIHMLFKAEKSKSKIYKQLG